MASQEITPNDLQERLVDEDAGRHSTKTEKAHAPASKVEAGALSAGLATKSVAFLMGGTTLIGPLLADGGY